MSGQEGDSEIFKSAKEGVGEEARSLLIQDAIGTPHKSNAEHILAAAEQTLRSKSPEFAV